MKTIKMSLANIEGKLSRKEMKGIMAGSGSGGGWCGHCLGSIGEWYGSSSGSECTQFGEIYCRSGASICNVC